MSGLLLVSFGKFHTTRPTSWRLVTSDKPDHDKELVAVECGVNQCRNAAGKFHDRVTFASSMLNDNMKLTVHR